MLDFLFAELVIENIDWSYWLESNWTPNSCLIPTLCGLTTHWPSNGKFFRKLLRAGHPK